MIQRRPPSSNTAQNRIEIPDRFPSLDGLRAVSILLVIAQHMSSAHQFGNHDPLWRFQLGDLGVRIFFVISGFLITSLLIREHQLKGAIDLRKFYARRFLRIFPAYYAFLGVVAALAFAGVLPLAARDFLSPFLYLANYIGTAQVLGHTWSLAVEQQFYLVWPLLIFLGGLRLGARAALTILVAAPLLRTGLSWGSDHPSTLWTHFETAGDAIAAGCVFALYRGRLWAQQWYRSLLTPALIGAILVSLPVLALAHRWPVFWNGIGITLLNLLAVLVVDGAMRLDRSLLFRFLNSRPLVFVGTISYSLYLWQQFFTYSRLTPDLPLSLVLMLATATASYYLIERPALRLKRLFGK